ncbi:uncharacterized protein LOC117114468 [Anneissia japonica]|uniref:uncharacterized protein LOC117114468 n=1 Tax=Anneissia japonica TaxID=1529436 RepID=UPI0014257EAF|nr:uncharacterized protein LOC117114468 [Anneissia japonica]
MYIALSCVLVFVSSSYGQNELEQVSAGIRAGNAIVQALGDEQYSKNFGKIGVIASKIGPFLGAIGPAFLLISAFLPGSPSPELLYMKRRFKEMDENFDKVYKEIGEVKTLIEKASLFTQYGEYEHTILIVSDLLQQFLNGTTYAVREELKNTFIDAYENTYDNAALRFWQGMTSELYVANNIPKTAMLYTQNHRGQVQRLMKGITNLIIKGVKVELSYMIAKGQNSTYELVKNTWEVRIKELITHMENADREVTNRWPVQSTEDLDNNLISLKHLSHKKFAEEFYKFLIEKYDWRDWHVVVYNQIQSAEHYVHLCRGYESLHKHGRNVAMASVNQTIGPILKAHVRNLLRGVSTNFYHSSFGGRVEMKKTLVSRNAKDIYDNYFPNQIKDICTYASAGAIKSNANVHHKALDSRFTSVVNGEYILHAFGGENALTMSNFIGSFNFFLLPIHLITTYPYCCISV